MSFGVVLGYVKKKNKMTLQAICSVFIHLENDSTVKIYFAQEVDSGVVEDIEHLALCKGVSVFEAKNLLGLPWIIRFAPNYDAHDIGLEIEEILKTHGITDLRVKVSKEAITDWTVPSGKFV